MDTLILFAEGFIGMFNKGGETLIGWVTGIIPTLVCLLVAMNAIVLFVGNERVEKFAHLCAGNPISRYVVPRSSACSSSATRWRSRSGNSCPSTTSPPTMRRHPPRATR